MAIESVGYISDLNSLWPASSESPTGADDHLRLIKEALKNSFPGVDGEVDLTTEEFNGLVDGVANAVKKVGDSMSGDLRMTDYKGVVFALSDESDIFGRVVGRDDTVSIEILDTDGTVLNSINIDGTSIGFQSVASGVTPDGASSTDMATVEYVDNRNRMTIIRDTKPAGTDAGDFPDRSWVIRDLDDTPFLDELGVTVLNNQITLPEGDYLIQASAPAHGTNGHVVAWWDVANSTFVRGPNEFAPPEGDTRAHVITKQSVTADMVTAGENVFELRHQAQVTNVDDGLGSDIGFGSNVYAEVIIRSI